jgi:RimJ/RimL family protein N-acetyltransferase
MSHAQPPGARDAMTGPAYRIETERLVIRCWEPKDARALNVAIRASWEHLGPWMPWARGFPPPLEDTLALIRRWRGEFDLGRDFVYAIFSRDETLALGSTGLHLRRGESAREIGYWVHVDHIGHGYATETAAALTKVAFEIDDVERVEIHCLPNNARSAAVPRKLGFTHEATLRERLSMGDGTYGDSMIWSLFAEDYPDSPAAEADLRAFDALGRRIL